MSWMPGEINKYYKLQSYNSNIMLCLELNFLWGYFQIYTGVYYIIASHTGTTDATLWKTLFIEDRD